MPAKSADSVVPTDLLTDLRVLIEQARDATARTVNSAIVLVYWNIGDRIRRDILRHKRASYGEQILPTLSAKLVRDHTGARKGVLEGGFLVLSTGSTIVCGVTVRTSS